MQAGSAGQASISVFTGNAKKEAEIGAKVGTAYGILD
jgi:hypothetical protein